MKLLHTESSLGWGGQEMRIVAESEGLTNLGYDVRICCAHRSMFDQRGQLDRVKLIKANIARKSIKGVLEIYRVLKSYEPDLVVTHSSTDSWLVAVARIFTVNRPRLVRVRHVSAPIRPDILTCWLYRQANHVITTSEAIKKHVLETTGVTDSKITSIPTGIARKSLEVCGATDVNRQQLNIDKGCFIVLMVATLRSWKGHADVITALSIMRDQSFKLLVVGDGPQLSALRQLAREKHVDQQVEFLGHQKLVGPFFNASDCFCQPSIRNEGVSQAVLQAFFTKVPVIATEIPGLDEVVSDETAWVVRPQRPEEIAAALLAVRKDCNKAKERAAMGYERVNTSFSFESMLRNVNACYRIVAGG